MKMNDRRLALLLFCFLCRDSVDCFSASKFSGRPQTSSLPEDVVAQQLKCLQYGEVQKAYQDFMSNDVKIATENSWRLFAEELEHEQFAPILGHLHATVLTTAISPEVVGNDDYWTAVCLVRMVRGEKATRNEEDEDDVEEDEDDDEEEDVNPIPRQYWWELSVDPDTDEWVVDGVTPDFESMDLEDGLFIDEDGAWMGLDDEEDF